MSSGQRRILFIGSRDSVFVTRTAEFLTTQGFEVTVIDPWMNDVKVSDGMLFQKIWKTLVRWNHVRKSIAPIPRRTAVIVHSISRNTFWLIPQLKRRFSKVVAIAYGSDVLRRNRSLDWILRLGLKKLDAVAATNNNVLDCLIKDFPFLSRKEHKVVRFGLPLLPWLDHMSVTPAQARQELGFDPQRPLISLGYSASEGQRQLELIKYFSRNAQQWRHFQFVVPVQYGSEAVAREVEHACDEANAAGHEKQFRALKTFYDVELSALMRRATTLLINHSISDAFSGTVQEVVYAGGLVAAGNHLPYKLMPGFGSAIKPYGSLQELSDLLQPDMLNTWQQDTSDYLAENRWKLNSTSSWEAVFPTWEELILWPKP